MKLLIHSLSLILSLCIATPLLAQDDEVIELSAKQYFESANYVKALEKYSEELEKKPDDVVALERIGVCHVNLNTSKNKSIEFLEKAVQSGKATNEALYNLGRAYHLNNKLTNALKYYNLYLPKAKDANARKIVTRKIEMVNNAKEIMSRPVNVTFHNLGSKINSKFADFNPFVPKDESFLVFATKRYGVTGSFIDYDGFYTSDIFFSKLRGDNFYKPKSIGGTINSELVEAPVGISLDGKTIFFNADNYNATGDVWYTQLGSRGRSFSPGKEIKGHVNTGDGYESGAITSADGTLMIFASEREGGFGGTDLYYSHKLPTGDWGVATNLGASINTPYDEVNPQLSFDETIIYFASEGHTSIGGYDIFKATWDAENIAASNIQNMGYPINTTDDQMTYCPTVSNRFGYIAAIRPEGMGDLDLYRIEFNEEDPQYTVIKTELANSDSASNEPVAAFITITNSETEEIAGTYDVSKSKNGKFIMALPPGSYELMFESDEHKMKLQKLVIRDKANFKSEIEKVFTLENNPPEKKEVEIITVDAKDENSDEAVNPENTSITKKNTGESKPETTTKAKDDKNTFVKSYPEDRVIYKIQVEKTNAVLSNSLVHKLKQLGVNKEILKGGTTVYTKGNFMNSIEAIKLAKEMKGKGFKIAFPIAILNGEKIPLQKGIEFQKSKAQGK